MQGTTHSGIATVVTVQWDRIFISQCQAQWNAPSAYVVGSLEPPPALPSGAFFFEAAHLSALATTVATPPLQGPILVPLMQDACSCAGSTDSLRSHSP